MYLYFFIVPCYYITCFGCLMGFTKHFYIIFGTNLLTQSPMPVSVFSLFLSFTEKKYQTESKQAENLRWFFLDQKTPRGLGVQVRRATRRRHGWRARPRGACHSTLWAPRWLPDLALRPIYSHIFQNPQGGPRKYFSATATFCSREIPISEPFSASCRRGIRSRRASTSTLLPFQWSVSSLPQTYGSIASI